MILVMEFNKKEEALVKKDSIIKNPTTLKDAFDLIKINNPTFSPAFGWIEKDGTKVVVIRDKNNYVR